MSLTSLRGVGILKGDEMVKPYRDGKRVIIECDSEMDADATLGGILFAFGNREVAEAIGKAVKEVEGSQQAFDDMMSDFRERWEIV